LQMDEADISASPQTMFATRMDHRMQASVLRFLEAVSIPMEARILGKALVKEIYLRVLTGEQGAYWTFLIHTGERTFVGASPERHITLHDGSAVMKCACGPACLLLFTLDPAC